jgi:hypothetical protein
MHTKWAIVRIAPDSVDNASANVVMSGMQMTGPQGVHWEV